MRIIGNEEEEGRFLGRSNFVDSSRGGERAPVEQELSRANVWSIISCFGTCSAYRSVGAALQPRHFTDADGRRDVYPRTVLVTLDGTQRTPDWKFVIRRGFLYSY